MLSLQTILPNTLELLKTLSAKEEMPTMFIADTWDSMKECIVEAVKQYQK